MATTATKTIIKRITLKTDGGDIALTGIRAFTPSQEGGRVIVTVETTNLETAQLFDGAASAHEGSFGVEMNSLTAGAPYRFDQPIVATFRSPRMRYVGLMPSGVYNGVASYHLRFVETDDQPARSGFVLPPVPPLSWRENSPLL